VVVVAEEEPVGRAGVGRGARRRDPSVGARDEAEAAPVVGGAEGRVVERETEVEGASW